MASDGCLHVHDMNSITHYTKKRQILARKELALRRLASRHAREEKILKAAQEVRDARVRVLRALRATIVPKDDAKLHYRKIDQKIETIQRMSPVAILAEFGVLCGENQADDTR